MAVMDEIVLQRVEFSCALSVFCVRVFFLSANLTLGEDFFPPGYWDNLSMSGVF